MSPHELQEAYRLWLRHYENLLGREEKGLKFIRESLLLSVTTVADRLAVSRNAIRKIELSEKSGKINLLTLRKVAEALDCELVYEIRPKSGRSFSQQVWDQVLEEVGTHPWLAKCYQRRRAWALAALAREKMRDTKFRKKQGWGPLFQRK